MNTETFSVAIVGAGPTGLVLANLLGLYGVSVLLLERETATVGEARAVTIDDESLRTMQNAGLIEQVLKSIVQGYGVHYYSWRNRHFASIEPTSLEYGYPKRNAFRQQVLLRDLAAGLARFPHIHALFGHSLVGFEQDADAVALTVEAPDGIKQFRCSWLIACDGGRSPVRERLGLAMEGSTYDEKWLIADLLDRKSPFRHTRTYCDPRRPAIRLPGPDGTLRYEFMLHEGETAEQALQEDQLRSWIRDRDPADANLPLVRKVVYAFHARIASRWRVGRVLLAGDAAHLTPPFAGQGMNSGVRDAFNLAWKLAWVTQGGLPAQLMDTYEAERRPHAWSLIKMALTIGRYMQPKSAWSAALSQGLLKVLSLLLPPVRDYVLQLKFKPRPRYELGFFVHDELPARVRAGELFPQPRVELKDGSSPLLDDVLGQGFAALRLDGAAPQPLPAWLEAKHVIVVRRQDDFLAAHADLAVSDVVVRDREGTIESLLKDAGACGVLLRPDRYVLAYIRPKATGIAPLDALTDMAPRP